MNLLHYVRSKVNQFCKKRTLSKFSKMAIQNTQYIQDPKMYWTKDAGLLQQFKDWREETELLLDTVLSHIKNQETKLKYVSLWARKEARTYLSTVSKDDKDSLKTMLDTHSRNGPNPNLMRLQHSHTSEP